MKHPGALFTNGKHVVVIASNRDVRRVPLAWRHPVDASGQPIPLQDRRFPYTEEELRDLLAEGATREELDAQFMPDVSQVPPEQTGVAVYETTTKGTPITPVFPDTHEGLFALLQYCALHCTTFANVTRDIDGWARILGLGHVLEGREAS